MPVNVLSTVSCRTRSCSRRSRARAAATAALRRRSRAAPSQASASAALRRSREPPARNNPATTTMKPSDTARRTSNSPVPTANATPAAAGTAAHHADPRHQEAAITAPTTVMNTQVFDSLSTGGGSHTRAPAASPTARTACPATHHRGTRPRRQATTKTASQASAAATPASRPAPAPYQDHQIPTYTSPYAMPAAHSNANVRATTASKAPRAPPPSVSLEKVMRPPPGALARGRRAAEPAAGMLLDRPRRFAGSEHAQGPGLIRNWVPIG
jgi:hypothetical protein